MAAVAVEGFSGGRAVLFITTVTGHVRQPFRRQVAPGTAPGAVVADPRAESPRIQAITYDAENLSEQEIPDVRELRRLHGTRRVTWVNIVGLGEAEVIKQVGEMFGLHRLALEDVVHVHQRAKVEEYDEQLFLIVRSVVARDALSFEQIGLFLGKDFVVSFQERSTGCFEPVRERIRTGWGRIRQSGPDYLVYALVDAVVDRYFPVVEEFGSQLEDLDAQITEHPPNGTISVLHRTRAELLMLRKTLWPHREAINHLLRNDHPLISPEMHVYLRDCYDHTIQLIDVVETYREMCSDLREFYFARQSSRTNDVMKVLTIIATIFMPLSFIAGVYGMNFDSHASAWNMPELRWAFGYPFALLLMALVAGGFTLLFRRRGWIGSDGKHERNPGQTSGV